MEKVYLFTRGMPQVVENLNPNCALERMFLELCDTLLDSIVDRFWWSSFELFFQHIKVFNQFTFRLIEIQALECIYATILIHPQITTQSLLADLHNLPNFLMLVAKRFQIHGLHPLAHPRMGMVSPLML